MRSAKWPYTTQRWRRMSEYKRQLQPLCEACLQQLIVTPADLVDHRVAIKAGGDPFPPMEGLASLCTGCHNGKTAAERRGENYWRKGCNILGEPLDPNHPWNLEKVRKK